MQTKHLLIGIGLLLGVTFLIFVLAVPKASGATPTSGVPVRCSYLNANSGPGFGTLACQAADGTPFVGGQQVPSGYYFMVTDIVVTPNGGGGDPKAAQNWDLFVNGNAMELGWPCYGGLHHTFTTPYFVLSAGQVITVVQGAGAGCGVGVYVSGILATNVTYFPLVSR